MKKSYMKPMVYFEQFNLSQSIAAGCNAGGFGGYPNSDNTNVCGWDLGGASYFNTGIGDKCSSGEIPGMCYNGPDGGYVIFAVS